MGQPRVSFRLPRPHRRLQTAALDDVDVARCQRPSRNSPMHQHTTPRSSAPAPADTAADCGPPRDTYAPSPDSPATPTPSAVRAGPSPARASDQAPLNRRRRVSASATEPMILQFVGEERGMRGILLGVEPYARLLNFYADGDTVSQEEASLASVTLLPASNMMLSREAQRLQAAVIAKFAPRLRRSGVLYRSDATEKDPQRRPAMSLRHSASC